MERHGIKNLAAQLLANLEDASKEDSGHSRQRSTFEAEQRAPEPVVRQQAKPVDDLSQNVFYNVMNDDGATEKTKAETIRGKIVISQEDTQKLKPEDLARANETLAQLEQYHTFMQDNSIDTDLASIKQLMDRIKNSIAPDMKKMIESLTSTNGNIGECRDLLDVLKVARMLGKTVEELQTAIRENDALEKKIAVKRKDIEGLTTEIEVRDELVGAATAEISASGSSFFGGLRNSTFGVPSELTQKLERARASKANKENEKARAATELAALETKLRTDLDQGALRILRSFDMTQDGLKTKIHSAAQDVIDVVENIRASVKTLLARVDKSEKAVGTIVDKIEGNRIDRTVLISAINEAYHLNQEQADKAGERVKGLQQQLDDAAPDSVESGKLRIDFMRQNITHKGLLDYGERMNRMLRLMQTNDANSVLSINEAERMHESVHNNKEGLNTLYNSTLPALSEAMRLVLHQFVDEQDQEFRMAIGEVTKNLSKTAQGTAERALTQQSEFHAQRMDQLQALIDRLNGASDLLGRALEEGVKSAVAEEGAYKGVAAAAGELREGVDAASEVRARVRETLRDAKAASNELLGDPKAGAQAPSVGGTLGAPNKAASMALAL